MDVPIDMIAWRIANNLVELQKRPFLKKALSCESIEQCSEFVRKELNMIFEYRLNQYKKADLVVADCYSTPSEYAKKIKKLIL